jgi:heme exporter protein A
VNGAAVAAPGAARVNGAAVAARGLEKRFGSAVALAGIDVDVPAGGSLAVLGPNGAGKTTLLRLMAGLGRPTAGSVVVGGERADRRGARARVGYIGHQTFLYAALTARENLLFAARLYGVPDPAGRADALLAGEGLGDHAELPAGAFSRGMAQRLAIARALVHDPDIVLLDEPFTGLDHAATRRLAARLAGLRDAGHTLVLVTHDVERAAELGVAAIVLARGRIVHAAAGAALAREPLERAIAEAAGAAP